MSSRILDIKKDFIKNTESVSVLYIRMVCGRSINTRNNTE